MGRQRKSLPCGHWLHRLEFRFDLNLCLPEARHSLDRSVLATTLPVSVVDIDGSFFGVTPDAVATDPAARRKAQQLLDSLLRFGDGTRAASHTLAAYRVDGPAMPAGAYVV